LSKESGVKIRGLAMILRNYFFDKIPTMQNQIDHLFLVGHSTIEKYQYTSEDIEKLGLRADHSSCNKNDLMQSLEITLFQDFNKVTRSIEHKRDAVLKKKKAKKIKWNFSSQLRFFRDFILVFVAGAGLLLFLKYGNKYFENNLSKKITLFEDNYFWKDSSLDFQKENNVGKIILSNSELEKLEAAQNKEIFKEVKDSEERFEVESDVTIASIDTLPMSLSVDNDDKKDLIQGSYRKSFRVLLNSTEPNGTNSEIKKILSSFKAESVDSSVYDQLIPGGIYYNLFVPSDKVKALFVALNNLEKVTILETKPKGKTPKGHNRVFLWVKSI